MERNSWLLTEKHKLHKEIPILCSLLCCLLLTTFFGCGAIRGIKSTAEMATFMKDMTAQLKEREAFLIASAEKPLTESQEKLLIQLLQEEKSLDVVLSNQLYLTYLEKQVGAAHKDYPTYLAVVPTTEQKSATVFVLKEICPPEATTEHIQISTDFYFKFCELIVNEPDITSDSEEMKVFIKTHSIEPLMDTYSSEMSFSEMMTIMKISTAPTAMAAMDTDVFHKIWFEQLEVYGSREGLLRCAISTPDEFALIRSFFKDAAAFEKWIRLPPQQK